MIVWSYLDQLAKIPHITSFGKNKHVNNTEKSDQTTEWNKQTRKQFYYGTCSCHFNGVLTQIGKFKHVFTGIPSNSTNITFI